MPVVYVASKSMHARWWKALRAAGIHVVESPAAIGETVAKVIGK